MSKIGILIFLAFLVWQILSAIIQSAEKKKEQQRLQQMARQRAAQRGGATRSSGPELATSARQPDHPGAARARAETLAERRRAQLEELRARRSGRSSRPSPVQLRTGTAMTTAPPPVQPVPAPTARRRTIQTLKSGIQGWRQEQETDRKRREALREQHEEQERLLERRRQAEEASQRRREQARVVQAEQLPEAHDPYAITDRGRQLEQRLRSRLHQRQSLQELFLLKELLDQPVSLR